MRINEGEGYQPLDDVSAEHEAPDGQSSQAPEAVRPKAIAEVIGEHLQHAGELMLRLGDETERALLGDEGDTIAQAGDAVNQQPISELDRLAVTRYGTSGLFSDVLEWHLRGHKGLRILLTFVVLATPLCALWYQNEGLPYRNQGGRQDELSGYWTIHSEFNRTVVGRGILAAIWRFSLLWSILTIISFFLPLVVKSMSRGCKFIVRAVHPNFLAEDVNDTRFVRILRVVALLLFPVGALQSWFIVVAFNQGSHHWIEYGLASILVQTPLLVVAPDWASICCFCMYMKLLGTVRYLDPASYEYAITAQTFMILVMATTLIVHVGGFFLVQTRLAICLARGTAYKLQSQRFEEYRVWLEESEGANEGPLGRPSVDRDYWRKVYTRFKIKGYGQEGNPEGLLVLRKVKEFPMTYTLHVCPPSTAVACTSFRYDDEVVWIIIDGLHLPVPAMSLPAMEEAFEHRSLVWTDSIGLTLLGVSLGRLPSNPHDTGSLLCAMSIAYRECTTVPYVKPAKIRDYKSRAWTLQEYSSGWLVATDNLAHFLGRIDRTKPECLITEERVQAILSHYQFSNVTHSEDTHSACFGLLVALGIMVEFPREGEQLHQCLNNELLTLACLSESWGLFLKLNSILAAEKLQRAGLGSLSLRTIDKVRRMKLPVRKSTLPEDYWNCDHAISTLRC